ncbi:MAG: hypothetical protein BWY28_01883 [bacterium ADurb.Bin236]|nr:MAG: hypothetical protein BWY28_01883 [bacterium ADurb.Bin236]HOY61717.1 DUF2723 domain-containing protein [bacterium]HPN94555.1 DUF2723 domain-containing protein [bacterium]
MWLSKPRGAGALSAAIYLAGAALFLWSARPDMAWGDSADFVLSAHYLGVAHPTGYPLVTLLGKLALAVPTGEAGFRFGLVSVLSAAAALAVFFRVAARLGGAPAGVYAALVLGASTFLWSSAVALEVYTLNLLFCVALLALALPSGGAGRAWAAVFFAGAVGLGNHGTLAFPALLLGAAGLWTNRRSLPLVLFCGAFIICAGLSAYASLPLMSARSDLFDWNLVERAGNLPVLMSGRDFWVAGEYKAAIMLAAAKSLAGSLLSQSSILLAAGAAAAFFISPAAGFRRWLLAGVFALGAFFPVMYPTHEKEEFFLPACAAFLLLGAAGLGALAGKANPAPARKLAAVVIAAACVAHPAWLLYRNNRLFAVRLDDSPRAYSEAILRDAPRDAIIFIDHVANDTVAPPLHYQFIPNVRRDAFVFHRLYLAFPWYAGYMGERARGQGHPAAIPEIDLAVESGKQYPLTPEEFARLREGRTINLPSVNIQTAKIAEANAGRCDVLANTTRMFHNPILESTMTPLPSGSLFALNAREGTPRDESPPALASAGSLSSVFDALTADMLTERARHFADSGRHSDVVSSLSLALQYSQNETIHCGLADAHAKLGASAEAEKFRALCADWKLKAYDIF